MRLFIPKLLDTARTRGGDTTFRLEYSGSEKKVLRGKQILKMIKDQNEQLRGAKLYHVKNPDLIQELLNYEKVEVCKYAAFVADNMLIYA